LERERGLSVGKRRRVKGGKMGEGLRVVFITILGKQIKRISNAEGYQEEREKKGRPGRSVYV